MNAILTIGLGVSAALLLAAPDAQTTKTTWDSVYTVDQAKRGQALYQKSCSSCHAEDLGGNMPSPALAGPDFLTKWDGQTVGDLFEKIKTTMPATAPGSLTPAQTSDISAYILSSNKFPAGTTELPPDHDAVAKIQIQQTKK